MQLDKINALPFRAYNLIYNEWFRDENLQDSLTVPTGDGPDPVNTYNLVRRGKRHDYFTLFAMATKRPRCRTPLGTTANLQGTLSIPASYTTKPPGLGSGTKGYPIAYNIGSNIDNYYVGDIKLPKGLPVAGTTISMKDSGVTVDLSSAAAVTINSLRQAFQLQRLYERDARGGTRYTEILRAHFGVISPDARLQRPEYLGGSSTRININPVEQNSATDTTSPQGNLAAYGVLGDRVNGFTKAL